MGGQELTRTVGRQMAGSRMECTVQTKNLTFSLLTIVYLCDRWMVVDDIESNEFVDLARDWSERWAMGVAKSKLAASRQRLFDISHIQRQDAATTQSPLTGIAMPAYSTSRKRSLAATALPAQRTTARSPEKRLDSFLALGQLGCLQQEDQKRKRSLIRQGQDIRTWSQGSEGPRKGPAQLQWWSNS